MATYDSETKAVTGNHDGRDVPVTFRKYRKWRSNILTIITPSPDGNDTPRQYHTFGAIAPRFKGKGNPTVKDQEQTDGVRIDEPIEQQDEEQRSKERKKEFVRVKWTPDSQVPSLVIGIQRPDDGPDVTFRIFPNSIARHRHAQGTDEEEVRIAFDMTAAPQKDLVDPNNAQLQELLGQNNLNQVSLQLLPSSTQTCPVGTGQQVTRPRFYHISDRELHEIIRRWNHKEDLAPWEHAIAMLQVSDNIVLHEHFYDNNNGLFDSFSEHMRLCFKQCCTYGFWWFWTEQHPGDITEDATPWIDAPVPSWMVEQWSTKTGSDGQETHKPLTWSAFNRPTVFPNVKTACTAHMLALARGLDGAEAKQQALTELNANRALFVPFPRPPASAGGQDWFRVNVYNSSLTSSSDRALLTPKPGTPLKITFYELETESATRKTKFVYEGDVVENLFEAPNVAFVARVAGKYFEGFKEKFINCSIELGDRVDSVQHHHTAFSKAAKGLTRADEGIDWDRLLFDTPPVPSMAPRNVWTEDIKQYEGMKEEFLQEAKTTFNLNDQQVEFTKHFLENDTGVSVLFGAPGTGKSVNIMANIMLYLFLNKKYRRATTPFSPGKKVLATAPSNIAIDNLLLKCLDHCSDLEGLKLVRFRGGSPDLKIEENVEMRDADNNPGSKSYEDVLWDMMGEKLNNAKSPSQNALQGHEFSQDFMRTLKQWTKTHPSKHDVDAFFSTLKQLAETNVIKSAEERRKLLREKDELQERLYKAYFQEVDAVFATLKSSADPILRHFKPSCFKMDGVAQTMLGEQLLSILPHIETIENVVFSGDPQQSQIMRAPSYERNEFFQIQNESLLHKVWNYKRHSGRDHHFRAIELETQYRMDPEISRPIRSIFYQNNLTDADVTKRVQPVRETAKDYFKQKLGAAYDGNHRFGVDFSGENNQSKPWKDSKSLCNKTEANAICSMIKGLLEYTPPPSGRRIEPSDIVINTDYAGQESFIKVLLQAYKYTVNGVTKPIAGTPQNGIRVLTTSKSHGSEGNIQFISMVVNDVQKPESIRFIASPGLLSVKFSIAKYMQIVVGNFRPWIAFMKHDWDGWMASVPGYKAEFSKMILSFWPDTLAANCKIISETDFRSGMSGNSPPTKKDFPMIINVNNRKRPATGAAGKSQNPPKKQKKAVSEKSLSAEDAQKLNERRACLPENLDVPTMQAALQDVDNDVTLSEKLKEAMKKMIQRAGKRSQEKAKSETAV